MKAKVIFVVSFIFLFSLTFISPISYNLGPKVEIYNTKMESLNKQDISKTEDLAFKITLTNAQNNWVCSKHWSVKLNINKENEDKPKSLSWRYSEDEEFCLAPNKEFIFWLRFDEYNGLEDDKKMGIWTINPTIYTVNANVEKQGNLISFIVTKEEPSTNPDLNNLKNKFDENWTYWVIGIGGGLLIIIGLIAWLAKAFK